jgi:hypothetical protein
MMQQWLNEHAPVLGLDGEWDFTFAGQHSTIRVPGAWEAQGYARDADGPAVYQRQIDIPAAWRGQVIQLQFDAVSYHVEVEVNGTAVGTHTGLWTSFALDVTSAVRPGEANTIRLTIYKPGARFPMRECLAGFLPDVCLAFGGVWQNARLVAFPAAAISEVILLPEPASGAVMVKAALHHALGLMASVEIYAPDGNTVAEWRSTVTDSALTAYLELRNWYNWQPDLPALYRAEITLEDAAGMIVTQVQLSFGFRTLAHADSGLLLNNQPICLRGILNWGWYPAILCPTPDEATIRDEFRRVRAAGYNMVKLCLVVPSRLYFDIADEEGMLLWLELPMWLPQVTERLREQAPQEYTDILMNVHHHPSIVVYSLGCELSAVVDDGLLSQLISILRDHTAGVLVCDNSGSGEAYGGLAFDYADFNDYHFYADLHYFNPLLDHFRRDWRPARPWIFGEFCDVDDFRDIDEIAAAHDGELPWWLAEPHQFHPLSFIAYSQQRPRMAKLDIPFDAQALQRISRGQSFIVRKTILEKVRARASMGGYVVTGLRDTPIATSSMFDDLNRAKYDADAFREFNADSVLILEQGRRRTWKNGGDRPAPVDRNNFVAGSKVDFRIVLSQTGHALPAGNMRWRLLDTQHQPVKSGTQAYTARPAQHIPSEITTIAFIAPESDTAQQYTLEVELEGGIRNHWLLWTYPAVAAWSKEIAIYDPAGTLATLDDLYQGGERVNSTADSNKALLLCGVFTAEVYHYVQNGGRAIVLQTGDGSLPVQPCPFWREAIKLLYDHPILEQFPHNQYADLQFYHLATDYAVDTSGIQSQFAEVYQVQPVMRRLDARQFTLLDYLVELKIGQGMLLASTLRFAGGAGDQVNGFRSNIAGRHLLSLMISYLLEQT